MSAVATIEKQRQEMQVHIKNLLKTGGLEVTDEDVEKTNFLLELHPSIMNLISDFEFSQQHLEHGFSQFELVNAEGAARFEHGQELNKDTTANAAVLEQKSQAIYQAYKSISSVIANIITNMRDPHERVMYQMMYIEGRRPVEVARYLEQGHKDLHAIGMTTVWDKKRRGLKRVAASLKLCGALNLVGEEITQQRRTHRKQYRLLLSEWDT